MKTKKLMSAALAFAMAASTMPVMAEENDSQNIAETIAEESTSKTSSYLFMETFEDDATYPVGVVADNTEGTEILKGSIGYVNYSLRPGTKLEIEKDSTENKYVKISGVANSYTNQAGTQIDFNWCL